MKTRYNLYFQNESIELLKTHSKCESEDEILLLPELRNNPRTIEIINSIYRKFDHSNMSSNWLDNLKTLLAHDFHIIGSSYHLKKSFEPLQFVLIPNNINPIHYGYFYTQNSLDTGSQFIKFCQGTEYPEGIHQYVIPKILNSLGGTLVARSTAKDIPLISLDSSTGIINSLENVYLFLSV